MKVTQSCPTFCDPMDYTVHEIFQARILEWVAFPFSRGSSQSRNWTQVYPHCRRILYQLSHKGNPRVRGVDFESFVDTAAIKWVQHVVRGLNRIILDTCSPQIPSAINLCKFTSALVTSACLKWKHAPAGFKIKLKW